MSADEIKKSMEDRSAMWPVIKRLFMENARDHVGKYAAAVACLITVALSTAFTAWVMESVINEAFTHKRAGLVVWI
ncbi:MAG: ABC transporter ATP-binding protein, partial [Hyphomicrobiales bacterium]